MYDFQYEQLPLDALHALVIFAADKSRAARVECG